MTDAQYSRLYGEIALSTNDRGVALFIDESFIVKPEAIAAALLKLPIQEQAVIIDAIASAGCRDAIVAYIRANEAPGEDVLV